MGPIRKVSRKPSARAKHGCQNNQARPGQSLHHTDKISSSRHEKQKTKDQVASGFPCTPCRLYLARLFRPAHIFDVAPVLHPFSISSSCCLPCSCCCACSHLWIHSHPPFATFTNNGWFSLSDLFSLGSRPDLPAHWQTAHQPDRLSPYSPDGPA